jgi:hypothetical protein
LYLLKLLHCKSQHHNTHPFLGEIELNFS